MKRVLYDDGRDVDLSILPYGRLGEVLSVNKSIMSEGYRVIYDSHASLLDAEIRALIDTVDREEPAKPTEIQFRNDVNDLLFHIVWSLKKIKRGELWVAVTCINDHIRASLLRLVELHNTTTIQTPDTLQAPNAPIYDGRFLEERTDSEIRAQLRHCFAKYDAVDAMNTLSHLIDTTDSISEAIAEENGYEPVDGRQSEMRPKLYREIRYCE